MSDFDGLIKLIYGGGDEPVPWAGFLNSILQQIDANYASLTLRRPTHSRSRQVVFAGAARPEIAAVYDSSLYVTDPFVNLPSDRMMMVEELIDEADWLKSPIYQEYLKLLDIRYFMGADLRSNETTICNFRVSRPINAAPFTERERSVCTLLLPHLKLAVCQYSEKNVIEAEREIYLDTVERLAIGTVMLDKNGRVLTINKTAEQILAERNGISLVQGKLHASNTEERRELHRLIEQAIISHSSMAPSVVVGMSIPRSGGLGSIGVLVRSAPDVEWSESTNRPAAILILRDSKNRKGGSQYLLQQLYDLTPAEAALVLCLLQGMTIDEAAASLSNSRNTVRSQLRSIFAKTGVTRQTELLNMVLNGVVPLV